MQLSILALSMIFGQVSLAQNLPRTTQHEVVPLRVGFVPNDADKSTDVHGFSVGLLGARVAQVHGVQLTSIYANVQRDLIGLQLSLGFNFVDGGFRGAQVVGLANFATDARGMQLAGGFNLARSLRGMQVALGNSIEEDGHGVQLGLMNGAGHFDGARLGLANGAEELRGVEVGLLNLGAQVHGLQIGLINVPCVPLVGNCPDEPRETHGVEVGIVNVAGTAVGLDVGGLNVARKAQGLQIGLINLALENEGESLALVNLVGNGLHELALYATEVMWSNLELKLGARHLYTALIAAYQPGDDLVAGPERFTRASRRFGFGLGLGWRMPVNMRRLQSVELELNSLMLRSTFGAPWREDPLLSSLRIEAAVRLYENLALLAGLTANVATAHGGRDANLGLLGSFSQNGDTTVRVFPGLVLGVQLGGAAGPPTGSRIP